MVTFGSRQIPTIFLQHLQNIFDFVLFHIIECFDYAGKGMNNNTFKQFYCVKSIKSNTIFYVSLYLCPPKTAYLLKSAAKLRLFLQYQA